MNAFASLRLSDHFRAGEFRCAGFIKCAPCACHGAVNVDPVLLDALEHIRAQVIGGPVIVLSGFRCDPYNEHVGGHPRSYHRFGMAADILCLDEKMDETAARIGQALKELLIDRGNVIYYPFRKFIHIDVGGVTPAKPRVRRNDSRPKPRGY